MNKALKEIVISFSILVFTYLVSWLCLYLSESSDLFIVRLFDTIMTTTTVYCATVICKVVNSDDRLKVMEIIGFLLIPLYVLSSVVFKLNDLYVLGILISCVALFYFVIMEVVYILINRTNVENVFSA